MVMIETLEERRLMWGTGFHHAPLVPFPTVFGLYDGTAVYPNGDSQTFTLLVTKQRLGAFVGTSTDFSAFSTTKVTGNVTRAGAVRFRMTVVHFPGVVTGQGTVDPSGATITAAVKIRLGRQTSGGTFTLVLDQSAQV